MLRSIAGLIVAVLLAGGCEGPMGPEGPQGVQGPQGEPGPGTRTVVSDSVDEEGVAVAALPQQAGSIANPPGLTCYLGPEPEVLLLVGLDIEGPICGIFQENGALFAFIVNAPPGWFALFVIVY